MESGINYIIIHTSFILLFSNFMGLLKSSDFFKPNLLSWPDITQTQLIHTDVKHITPERHNHFKLHFSNQLTGNYIFPLLLNVSVLREYMND